MPGPLGSMQAKTDGEAAELHQASDREALQRELAQLIVDTLRLGILPEEIDHDAPLFEEGLGLDSVDALQLVVAIEKRFGVRITADDGRNRGILASLRSLATHLEGAP